MSQKENKIKKIPPYTQASMDDPYSDPYCFASLESDADNYTQEETTPDSFQKIEKPQKRQEKQSKGKTKQPNKFAFFTLEDAEKAPLPKWLVHGIIIDGGVGQIYGESGAGKSFFCIDLAMHIINGWSYYGHKTIQRPVRYLVLEGGGGFPLRLRAYKQWSRVCGNTPSQIINGDFQYYVGDLVLMDENEIKELAADVPIGAVFFIDTQAQATVGLQENSSEISKAISNAQKLAKWTKGTVILVHHKGKNHSAGARGWSGQNAAWDFEIELSGKEQKIRKWKVTKCKDGPEGEKHGYSLPVIHIQDENGKFLFYEDGKPVKSCVAQHEEAPIEIKTEKPKKPNSASQQVLEGIALAMEKKGLQKGYNENCIPTVSIHKEELRQYAYKKIINDQKKTYYQRGLDGLKQLGFIDFTDDVVTLTEEGIQRIQQGYNVATV